MAEDEAQPRSATGRFEKGRSGNPRGRPKRKASAGETASVFAVIVDKTLTVTRDGVSREVTVEEALQHQTLKAAFAGERMAEREVLKMIARREKVLSQSREPPRPRIELKNEAPPPRNLDDALVVLGIARDDPRPHPLASKFRYMLLEPWAVKLALGRRRGGTALTGNEIEAVRELTAEPGSIRWPKGTKT
jgi:hypothetical protein